jgi:Rrf2 family protein
MPLETNGFEGHMKISSQEEYGLRCLLRLAAAEEGHSLTIPEIAAAEGISAPYVAKLLSVLRQAGLIDSARGRSGGYRLARPPAEVHLGAVLGALGEPFFDEPGFCTKHSGTETATGPCVHLGACTLRALWQTLEQWMSRALTHITLADLLQGEMEVTELLQARLLEAAPQPAGRLSLPSLSVPKD